MLFHRGSARADDLVRAVELILNGDRERARQVVEFGRPVRIASGLRREVALALAARIERVGGIAAFTCSAERVPLPERRVTRTGVVLATIRPGNPRLRPFLIATTPVTQALYRTVLGDQSCRFDGPRFPVDTVSYSHALRFCTALSILEKVAERPYRLPTEEEWVHAARADEHFRFAGGDHWAMVAWARGRRTQPVGRRRPNGWGLYDMSGNVWEWVALGKASERVGVLKGGAYDSVPEDLEPGRRRRACITSEEPSFGFRIVRSLEADPQEASWPTNSST